MVRVCDTIMGSGKSQSAISYMNDHPEKRFIYITPLLTECTRIKDACPALDFVEPSDKLPQYNWRKVDHTKALIEEGRNIATSHAAFENYTQEIVDLIKNQHYTLIVDEEVDVLQGVSKRCLREDLKILMEGGYITQDGSAFRPTGKEFPKRSFVDYLKPIMCNNLFLAEDDDGKEMFFWMIPYEIFMAFDDVFVLTYLFQYSDMRYFFDMYSIHYAMIGVAKHGDRYEFTSDSSAIPSHITDLKDKIHIYEDQKSKETGRLNKFAEKRGALSKSWYSHNKDGREIARKNMYNYFRNIRKAKSSDIMWASYKSSRDLLQGTYFRRSFTAFNLKATNDYRDRTELAYMVNVHADPDKKHFFQTEFGITYDEDGFALSTMIQWIWRSAIRDGKDIYIYLPSGRMRTLLENWLEEVS